MKIFCIGYNKTGTTSLSRIMSNNDISVAQQTPFEYNLESYFYGNYNTFTNMIKEDYYDITFFQDVPFSLPNMYKILDKEFPNSKFILTVRDNENEWYNSLIRFYKKGFVNFQNPHMIDYTYKGWIYKILTKAWRTPKHDPYNEQILKESYLKHNRDVENYFKNTDKLLKINLKDEDLIQKIESFLNIKFKNKNVPQLNKST